MESTIGRGLVCGLHTVDWNKDTLEPFVAALRLYEHNHHRRRAKPKGIKNPCGSSAGYRVDAAAISWQTTFVPLGFSEHTLSTFP